MSRHDKTNRGKPKRPKTRLGLPDLDHSRSAVLDSLRSRESKRGYRHAIDEFIQWYCSEPRLSFNKIVDFPFCSVSARAIRHSSRFHKRQSPGRQRASANWSYQTQPR
jgi:hypothetical protein